MKALETMVLASALVLGSCAPNGRSSQTKKEVKTVSPYQTKNGQEVYRGEANKSTKPVSGYVTRGVFHGPMFGISEGSRKGEYAVSSRYHLYVQGDDGQERVYYVGGALTTRALRCIFGDFQSYERGKGVRVTLPAEGQGISLVR